MNIDGSNLNQWPSFLRSAALRAEPAGGADLRFVEYHDADETNFIEKIASLRAAEDESAAGPIILLSSLAACLPQNGTALERELTPPFVSGQELEILGKICQEFARQGTTAVDVMQAQQNLTAQHNISRAPITGEHFKVAVETHARNAARQRCFIEIEERAVRHGYPSVAGYIAALAESVFLRHGHTVAVVRLGTIWPSHSDDSTCIDKCRSLLHANAAGQRQCFGIDADDLVALVKSAWDAVAAGENVFVHAIDIVQRTMSESRLADLVALARREPKNSVFAFLKDVATEVLSTTTFREWFRRRSETMSAPGSQSTLTLFPAGFRPLSRRATALRGKRNRPAPLRRRMMDEIVPWLTAAEARLNIEAFAPLRYTNLNHVLETAANRYSKKPALSTYVRNDAGDDTLVSLTYAELWTRARQTARRFYEAGARPGDRIVVSGKNSMDWVIAFFAIQCVGAVAVPVDPALPADVLGNILAKAKPTLLVYGPELEALFRSCATGDARELLLGLVTKSGGRLHEPASVDGEAVASILFTSGTTGEPKGVMLSHKNFTAQAASLSMLFDMTRDDRALSVLPLHHTLEFSCGLVLPMIAGAEIFHLDELSAERLGFFLRQAKITGMVGVPALWQLLERKIRRELDELDGLTQNVLGVAEKVCDVARKNWDLGFEDVLFHRVHKELGGHLRLLISGGAALPAETHRFFYRLGYGIREGYGLTETAPVLTVSGGREDAGSVGRPIFGVELRVDENTREIQARGPNIMLGYYENDAANQDVFTDDGWLKTGDLGAFDEDGRLRIVGRAKDVVVTASGENIYLDDTEALLAPFPLAAEYCLVGVDDRHGGEQLALAVVPAEGVVLTEQDVRRHARRLPAFARPAVIFVSDVALPKTATRKVKRKDVKTLIQNSSVKTDAPVARGNEPVTLTMSRVSAAVALVASADAKDLHPMTNLHTDLQFDSLLWVELAAALGPVYGDVDGGLLFECNTIGDVVDLLDGDRGSSPISTEQRAEMPSRISGLGLPRIAIQAGRSVLGAAQRELYRTLFDSSIEGRAHIPYNENVIVVANHCSHLDTGLVKYALGRYGADLMPLAAQDYFFEGNRTKVYFFENFTNLVALDRTSGSGSAFDTAKVLVRAGNRVLIYPEGTRRADGTLGDFKPLVGRLAMDTGVSILPVYLSGTFEALPRGAFLPASRRLHARIGQPIGAQELLKATADLSPVEATKAATALVHQRMLLLSAASREPPAPEAGEKTLRASQPGAK